MRAISRSAKSNFERLSGIRNKEDTKGIVEVFARAFASPAWMENHLYRSLFRPPLFDPEHARLAVADGHVVSALVMSPRMIRFGHVKVPAVTVGPVGTHDHYRNRGYAAATMNDASRYMKEHGILVAYLQGIPDFYNRFGYYPYMAPGTVRFKRDNAKKESRPGRLRAMTRKDLPAVRKLYDEATSGRTCTAARDAKVWDWLMGPGRRTWLFRRPQVILDGRGRLCGYVTVHWKDEPTFAEIIVRPDEPSLRAVLGALVRYGRQHEKKELSLPVPWDDALAVFLRHFVSADFRMSSGSTGGALLKIVDFPALMQRLEPLFARRWREAHSSLPPVEFTLSSEAGSVGFRLSRDGARVLTPGARPAVHIPQRWLSGLLTGYHAVRGIAPRRNASVPARLLPIMEILFPTGWPFVYEGDNY